MQSFFWSGGAYISDLPMISDEMIVSEEILVVGRHGEIFTTKRLRAEAGVKTGGRVRARIENGRLLIEPVPAVEDLLRKPVLVIAPDETEALSEETQKEQGAFG